MTMKESDLDAAIAQTLRDEDEALYTEFREQGLFSQFMSVFRGPTGWVSVASLIAGSALNALFFFAVYKFFTLAEMEARLTWFAIGWFSALMVGFMKVWFFIRMESNRTLRAIQRLELRLVRRARGEP